MNVWFPAAMNMAPPRPGMVDWQPMARLADSVADVTVICAPRGEFVSAEEAAGITNIAPPVGASFSRTMVESSSVSLVGAVGVFGNRAKAPPPTTYNERQLDPLTAEFDSTMDDPVTRASHAPARYIAPPRPEATLDWIVTPELQVHLRLAAASPLNFAAQTEHG